jgi:hypothetical protein
MTKERLVLCRPLGGLNDILCQIERVCRYGDNFGRNVVIDTDYHCTRSFQDKFSKYFVAMKDGLVLDADAIGDRMADTDVAPDFIAGRVGRYMTRYAPNAEIFVEQDTGRAVTFDFTKDHPERLLVHHGEGGGALSVFALSRLSLGDNLIAVLRQRLSQIGRPYTAIHIRHTDYKCEYEEWIERHKAEIEGPLFVASDNRDSIAYCKIVFGAERVYSFAALPEVAGQVLHLRCDRVRAYEQNSDAILDLMMLALSKRLHLLELLPNLNGARLSGFSTLAANLKRAPAILDQLLGRKKIKAT